MSYFTKMLRSQAPRPGQEEEAIQTLSNRLQHANLAADRKSAVLGLKSFSRQYRESVVQHGLRALLQTLAKDSDNAQLVKAVLETLLNLFLRTSERDAVEHGPDQDFQGAGWISSQSRAQNGKYPSPLLVEKVEIDEFSNWIADEMISTGDNVTSLMSILQHHTGFQIRLYSLQFLEAVVATRSERAKECILNIPLAVSTIVGLLDDPNDPIRNEAILLLMALVNNNYNIQKLVAFENTFERIFDIISEEGGIRGSILVQDCMTLLTNLLTYNASNQKFFLETDCVPKLAALIAEPIDADFSVENGTLAPPIVWTEQRLQNMAVLLDICRSFVDPENPHLVSNQEKLFSSGIFFSILRLVFSPVMENPIRKSALQVTGDIIANNAKLQLQFAQIDVPYIDPSLPLQIQKYTEPISAPLALLNWAVLTNSVHLFEVRLAAMHCLAKFFSGNTDAKVAFLSDQIKASKNPRYYSEMRRAEENGEEQDGMSSETHTGNKPEADTHVDSNVSDDSHETPYANIFTTLTVFNFDVKLNPYSAWFSAITLVYSINDCPETRQMARDMKVGNAEDGEEEMSAIQAISGILLANLENTDPRIAAGYLVLLTLWLFEDFDAVNDFLSDPSTIKSVVAFLSKNSTESPEIVLGMAAVLVGVCYDFTTKTSPLSRDGVYDLITKAFGADSYALKVKQFKNHELFKHFDGDLESGFEKDASGLPNLFFIPEYVELVKDNYYRIRKSLSRGPDFEPRSRISFEVFEELENKNVELKQALADLNSQAEEREHILNADIKLKEETLKSTSDELENYKLEVKEARHDEEELIQKIEKLAEKIKNLETEKEKFESSSNHFTAEFHKLSKKSASSEDSLKQLKQKLADSETARQKAEDGINKMSRELFQLSKQKKDADSTIANLEKQISRLESQHAKTIKDYQTIVESSRKSNEELRIKLSLVEQQRGNVSSYKPDDQLADSKMRDLQDRISEMEDSNENLLEKLRSAASVVQGLRTDKSDLKAEKESLESELIRTYEDLEAFTEILGEVEKSKAEKSEATKTETDSSVNDDIVREAVEHNAVSDVEASSDVLNAIREERDKLEARLTESEKTIESLQAALVHEQEKIAQKESIALVIDNSDASSKEVVSSGSTDQVTADVGNHESDIPNTEKDSQKDENLHKVEELTHEISILQSKLEESENSFKIANAEFLEETNTLQKEHKELLEECEKLKEDQKDILARSLSNEGSENETQKLAEEIKNRDVELEFSFKRIRDLEKNIEVLSESASSSLASFKSSQTSMQTRIDQLEESREDVREEIKDLRDEHGKIVEEFQDTYDELENAFMDLELSSANLAKNKEDLEKQLKKLQDESSSQIKKLSDESQTLRDQMNDAFKERDELRKEYYELEKSTNIIGSELKAKEALLQAMNNKGADLAAKDKIVIEIKEKLASTIVELGDSAQKLRIINAEKADLNKLYDACVVSLDKLKQTIADLESDVASKSEQLDKALTENRKYSSVQKDFFDANKANGGHLSKIEALESEIVMIKKSLSEAKSALDDQNKAHLAASSAAVLDFTEKSSRMEKSILENQELHVAEIKKIRKSTQEEIQKLTDALSGAETENKKLSDQLGEFQLRNSEAEANTDDALQLKELTGNLKAELAENKRELEQLRVRLSEKESELAARDADVKNLSEVHSDELQNANSEVLGLKSEVEKLRAISSDHESQIESLVQIKAQLAKDLEKSQEKQKETISVDVVLSELEESKRLHQTSEDRILAIEQELETKTHLLQEAHDSTKTLEEELKERQSHEKEIEILTSTIEGLESELKSLKDGEINALSKSSTATEGSHDVPHFGSDNAVSEADHQKLRDENQVLNEKILEEREAKETQEREFQLRLTEETEKVSEYTREFSSEKERLASIIEGLKRTQISAEASALEVESAWQEKLQLAETRSSIVEHELSSVKKLVTDLEQRLQTQVLENVAKEPVSETSEEDFTNLLLVCDDQERRIAKYKRKLRALDIEVSSDESDNDLL